MAPQNNDRVTSAVSNKPSGTQTHLDPLAVVSAAERAEPSWPTGLLFFISFCVFPLAGAVTANCEEKSTGNFYTNSKFLNFFGKKGQRVRKVLQRQTKKTPKKLEKKKKFNRFYVGVVRELSTLSYTRESVNAK